MDTFVDLPGLVPMTTTTPRSAANSPSLDPDDPSAWARLPYEVLLAIPRDEVETAQQAAFERRFADLRPRLEALDKLATRQGVTSVGSAEDSIPVFFDHRVLKSYPLRLIEDGDYPRLSRWLQRLTVHNLVDIP